jgi:hypothetical protein
VRGDGALFIQISSCLATLRQLRLPDAERLRYIWLDETPGGQDAAVPLMAMAPDGCMVIVRRQACNAFVVPQRVYETHEGEVKCERTFESDALKTASCVCASDDAIAVMHGQGVGAALRLSLFRRDGTMSWTTEHECYYVPRICFDADGAHVLASRHLDRRSAQVLAYSSVTGAVVFIVPHVFDRVESLAVSTWNEIVVCDGDRVAVVPFAEARVAWQHAPRRIDGCAVSRNTLLPYRITPTLTRKWTFLDEVYAGIAGLAFT